MNDASNPQNAYPAFWRRSRLSPKVLMSSEQYFSQKLASIFSWRPPRTQRGLRDDAHVPLVNVFCAALDSISENQSVGQINATQGSRACTHINCRCLLSGVNGNAPRHGNFVFDPEQTSLLGSQTGRTVVCLTTRIMSVERYVAILGSLDSLSKTKRW